MSYEEEIHKVEYQFQESITRSIMRNQVLISFEHDDDALAFFKWFEDKGCTLLEEYISR